MRLGEKTQSTKELIVKILTRKWVLNPDVVDQQ